MGRIYDYPIATPSVLDVITYTDVSDGNKTVTMTVGELITLLNGSNSFSENLSSTTTYQNDLFIGKDIDDIWISNAGMNARTGGLVSGFNSTTGTFTFNYAIQGLTQFAILG